MELGRKGLLIDVSKMLCFISKADGQGLKGEYEAIEMW